MTGAEGAAMFDELKAYRSKVRENAIVEVINRILHQTDPCFPKEQRAMALMTVQTICADIPDAPPFEAVYDPRG